MGEPPVTDVAVQVLDQQLLDCRTRHCGRVDDLEIELGPDGEPFIRWLLIGPSARRRRLRHLNRWLPRRGRPGLVRVPWSQVDERKEAIVLRDRASVLGLEGEDGGILRWLRRLPGS
ncbi:MAG: hypothetical protein QOD86_1650 [Miltoncostaeaceae bacterium]|jgi:sporulation protein YlmC with PRC-barrel domain|nr:hypothetical protein [Miltoncostaeaceae bacterium]